MKNKIVLLSLFASLNAFATTPEQYQPTPEEKAEASERAECAFQEYIKKRHSFNECFIAFDLLTNPQAKQMPTEIKTALQEIIQNYRCFNHFSFTQDQLENKPNLTRAKLYMYKEINDQSRDQEEQELAQKMNKTTSKEFIDLKNRIDHEKNRTSRVGRSYFY